jgi:hypothetical protein
MKALLPLFFALCAVCPRAADAPMFDLQAWFVEVSPAALKDRPGRLPLGKVVYIPAEVFASKYRSNWFMSSGCDLMTAAPLRIRLGESNGFDISDFASGINRPIEKFPIPKIIPGFFLRVRAGTNENPIALNVNFVFNARDEDGGPVERKEHFEDVFNFRSNEVAIVRLAQTTYTIESDRTLLGIPFGKRSDLNAREFYCAFQLNRTTNTQTGEAH